MVAVLVRRCQELEGNLSKFRDQANTIRELLRTKVSVHLSSSFSVCELSHVLLLFGIIPKLLKLKILFHNFVPHMYCHTWASTVCCLLFCTPKYSMFFLEQYHVPIKKNADLRHTYFSPSHAECEVVLWRFQTLKISKFLLLLLSISIRYL